LINPPKVEKFDICFHRRDAEYAEDLFYFLLSAERAENKNQETYGALACYEAQDVLIM
jgi:hypothetical protein